MESVFQGACSGEQQRKVRISCQVREGVSCCSSAGNGTKWKQIQGLRSLLGRVRDSERAIKNAGFAGIKPGRLGRPLQCSFVCQMGATPSTFRGHCEDRIMHGKVHRVSCHHSIVLIPIFSVFILVLHHHLREAVSASQTIGVM